MEYNIKKIIYCKKLGHKVQFSYCREVGHPLPCGSIVNCWHEEIPIQKFIYDNYSEEEIKQIFSLPKPKLHTILDLVEKAKNSKNSKNEEDS